MWFFIFIAYLVLPASSAVEPVEPEPLIETLPNDAFTTPIHFNHPACYEWGARRTGNAWCARDNSAAAAQYLQVDLGESHDIYSVSTWTRKDLPSQYVKTYKLSYSTDGVKFTDYAKTLNGNTAADANQEVKNVLEGNINARYLKFTPLTYAGHKSMRIEAYGNKAAVSCDACQIAVVQSEIDDVNKRLDEVVTKIGGAWDDLSAANAMPAVPMPEPDNNYPQIKIKNWFNNYRDYLIVLSLTLNMLLIAYEINSCQKYESYRNVKYIDSSDNENAAINL